MQSWALGWSTLVDLWTLPPVHSLSLQGPPSCRRCGSGSRHPCFLPPFFVAEDPPQPLAPLPAVATSVPIGHQAPTVCPPSEASTRQGLGLVSPALHTALSQPACRPSTHVPPHAVTNILSFVVLWLSCAHSHSRGQQTVAGGSNNHRGSPQNPILNPHLGPPVGRKMSSSSEGDVRLRQHSFAVV